MNIRKTEERDLECLMTLFEEARHTIAALGINQWQDGYPNREVIQNDMKRGDAHVVVVDGEVCGTFAMIRDGEPTYDRIDGGHWLTGDDNRNYMAIHRVAISVAKRGSGLSTAILTHAAEEARNSGMISLRIDTHEGNRVMRRMLEKHGFQYCGVIWLQNGDPRVAYEKTV